MKKTLLTLLGLIAIVALFAQQNPDFSYQGVATDRNGELMTRQSIKVRATVLFGWASPANVYNEVHYTTTDEAAGFVIILGEGSRLNGHIDAIDWNRGDYFLRLEVSLADYSSYHHIGTSQIMKTPNTSPAGSWQLSGNRLTTENGLLLGSHRSFGRTYDTYPLTIIGEQALPRFPNRHRVISLRDHNEQVRWHFNLINGNLTFTAAEVQDGILMLERRGNVGIGTIDPRARLHLPNGDIYLENPNNGVIMTSPNGQCWRMTVSDEGQPVFSSVACP